MGDLDSTFAYLDHLAQLRPGWDSYDAAALTPAGIQQARDLLAAVAAISDSADQDVKPFAIAPLVDGGVQLEWRSSRGAIEVEIAPDAAIGYLHVEDEGERQSFTESDAVSLDEVSRLVRDLISSSGTEAWQSPETLRSRP